MRILPRPQLKTFLPPAFIALITYLLRLDYSHLPRTVWGDEPFYLWLGRNWFQGRGYSFAFTGHWDYHHTPGYPFLTAVLTPWAGSMQRASEWNFILFSVILALAVYALARRIYGPRSALAAGLIVALAPATALMPLYWGTMTEPPYLALAFVGLYFAHRALHRFTVRDIVLAAIFLALSYYIRPEAVVYWGAMGLVLGIKALSQPPRWRRLAYPALLGLVFLLILFPYLNLVHQATGTWAISEKVGAHFATAAGLASGRFQQFDIETWGLDSTGLEVRFFSRETADTSAMAYIMADPIGYLKTIYGNLLKLLSLILSPHLLPAFALLFMGLAWWQQSWDKRRFWDELFLVATLLPGISFILFFVQERYIATLLPPLFIWFGHGVILTGDWLRTTLTRLLPSRSTGQRWARHLTWAPLLILLLFFVWWTPRQIGTATNPGSTRPIHDQAAAALAPMVQPGDIVMARYVSIAFEAGAEWVPSPAATIAEAMAFARHKGVRYWAIDGFEAHKLRPQYAPLVDDPQHPPPGLEFVTVIQQGDDEPVVIYRFP